MNLPLPASDQAYWNVSALESGHVRLPLPWLLDNAKEGEVVHVPSLSFLLRHSFSGDTLVVDLGIRNDWQHLPPLALKSIADKSVVVDVPQDVSESLRKGGMDPADVCYVCLTHVHFDHSGDSTPFANATFILTEETHALVTPGWPADQSSRYASDIFPRDRMQVLSTKEWSPLGPFPRTYDLLGDGSLYLVDAPGHVAGHMNVLARTSAGGGWILFVGDSAHHPKLIRGEAHIADTPRWGCAHADKEKAEEHIQRIRRLTAVPGVRIMLAHDSEWYADNKDGPAFFPGTLKSL
ncbi:Metallo-hydrolase/oxidoreductase [Obba rivulosa]|uniref:Metallo-hydrolase/oxidoreductase n=1 Tax=Obba rivulosa TaxID=1052685 RepID=A0A8E2DSY2_9APHY|nr:Metallo-hydrolase/oxidoreductase [Obba rivulosa]